MADPDPYKVLKLDKNFTLDQLKRNYKRLALQLHPDKNVVSPEDAGRVFQVLTNCYKLLLRDYEARQSDKPFYQLKQAYQNDTTSHHPSEARRPSSSVPSHDGRFDVDKFNRVFSENAIQDAYAQGYDKWIEKSAEAPMQAAEKEQKRHDAIVKHQYPQPFAVATKSKIDYYELGVDRVQDFSANQDGISHGVTFMDYKRAHTTTKIVDPTKVKPKKEYKTVQELEADRANVTFTLSAREAARQEKLRALQERREEARVAALRQQDALYEEQFKRVNRLMLGGRQ